MSNRTRIRADICDERWWKPRRLENGHVVYDLHKCINDPEHAGRHRWTDRVLTRVIRTVRKAVW